MTDCGGPWAGGFGRTPRETVCSITAVDFPVYYLRIFRAEFLLRAEFLFRSDAQSIRLRILRAGFQPAEDVCFCHDLIPQIRRKARA